MFSTPIRQVKQAAMSYSSAVESFRFSTTDYCTVELASAAKLTQYSLRGREIIFYMTHRGHTHRAYKFSKWSEWDQTIVLLKRSSGHKRYYPPQFKHPPRIAAARVLRDNPPWKDNTRCESKEGYAWFRCKFISKVTCPNAWKYRPREKNK